MGLGALQPMHLIVVLVIVLLVFGPGKLPELGKAVGDGLRELKKATVGEDKEKTEAAAAAMAASTVTPISATPSAPTMASRPCPSCRGPVPVGDKFCGNCGTTLEVVSRSA
jgi:sec-independent protein translocase protein TatA